MYFDVGIRSHVQQLLAERGVLWVYLSLQLGVDVRVEVGLRLGEHKVDVDSHIR